MVPQSNDDRSYTNASAAKALGVGMATVKRWRSKGWIVNREDGSLDHEATIARAEGARDPTHGGRADRVAGGSTAGNPPPNGRFHEPPSLAGINDSSRLLNARAISATADARLKQLRIQKQTGDLIPRAMTTSIFVDALATVRTTLEAMPTRLSHRLVGLDALAIRSVLLAEVDSILKEMADGLAAP